MEYYSFKYIGTQRLNLIKCQICYKEENFLQKTFPIKSFNSMLVTSERKIKFKFEYLIKTFRKRLDDVSMKIKKSRI